jgi:hypothetical protein
VQIEIRLLVMPGKIQGMFKTTLAVQGMDRQGGNPLVLTLLVDRFGRLLNGVGWTGRLDPGRWRWTRRRRLDLPGGKRVDLVLFYYITSILIDNRRNKGLRRRTEIVVAGDRNGESDQRGDDASDEKARGG